MRAVKAIGLAWMIGASVVGGCHVIAGIPDEYDKSLTTGGSGSGSGSGSSSSGMGQACSNGQECPSTVCNGGFCCVDPLMEKTCENVCGNVTTPCGATVQCDCAQPNLCGGGGEMGKCGCVACPSWQAVFGLSTSGLNGADLALDASGNVVLAGDFASAVNFGGGNINSIDLDAFLGKLKADGSYGGWGKGFGSAGSTLQTSKGVAIDNSGNVILVGEFRNFIDFGAGPLTFSTSQAIYVAKFDNTGQHLWSKAFGTVTESKPFVTDVAVDLNGNVILVGDFEKDLNFGGGALTYVGGRDVFIAKLDATGGHVWSESFGYAGDQFATGVAVDGMGNIFMSGYFASGIDFGGIKMSQGGQDAFVARVDPGGSPSWMAVLGDGSDQSATDIAIDASNHLVVTGTFQGTINWGGAGMISSNTVDNVFVGAYDLGGAGIWAKVFGGSETTRGRCISGAANGDILIAGTAYGAPDFGGGPRNAYGVGMFMARLGSNGDHIWSKGNTVDELGGAHSIDPFAIAEGSNGKVVLGGIVGGQMAFGLGPLQSNQAIGNIFVLQLNGL